MPFTINRGQVHYAMYICNHFQRLFILCLFLLTYDFAFTEDFGLQMNNFPHSVNVNNMRSLNCASCVYCWMDYYVAKSGLACCGWYIIMPYNDSNIFQAYIIRRHLVKNTKNLKNPKWQAFLWFLAYHILDMPVKQMFKIQGWTINIFLIWAGSTKRIR